MTSPMVNVQAPRRAQQYQAPQMRLGRSQISLAHEHMTTFDAGQLIPYLVAEVIPGDTFTCRLDAFARIFSPLDAPIMDNIEMSIDFFFVPNRLVWENWTAFLGEHNAAGAQDTDYTVPIHATGTTITPGDVLAYMGVPLGLSTTTEDVDCLKIRAYQLIYNEWYRDQNLIDSVTVATDDGPDSTGGLNPYVSAKKPDYFTSALPYLQKGTAQEVSLTNAPIHTDNNAGQVLAIYSTTAGGGSWRQIDSGAATIDVSATGSTEPFKMYADLSSGIGLTINAFREAAAIQRMLERDARGGTRHPEIIRSHFGVDVPDYRTQRPEYLGGGKGWIHVTPIGNTVDQSAANAASGVDVFQGELKGIGTGQLRASWAKSFVEHGHVLGILRARAELSYSQGLERMWSRSTKYDFLWPELSMLGEQPIYNKELWIEGDSTDDAVFGYQERYADYRFKKSLITGLFAPDASGSLDFWHLSEDFASQPALNQTFVQDASPMDRIRSTTTGPDFLIDGRFDMRVARALPVRPAPTLMPARF